MSIENSEMDPIEQAATRVLAKLFACVEETYAVDGRLLMTATGLTCVEINDAVDLLEREGAATVVRGLGTHPFKFARVKITTAGKQMYYRSTSSRTEATDQPDERQPQLKLQPPGAPTSPGRKVFIVHGHDEEMKKAVQLLLARAGLEDVVLHECPDRGRTVIDKLIEEGEDAAYVVALLSPDDTLADGRPRARQNVILEIGYFLGHLGKERVRLLKRGDIEIPSDLKGILYEEYDEAGNWRMKLLKEIKAARIVVDLERTVDKL
jgi:predicted nucleotide-binding protein